MAKKSTETLEEGLNRSATKRGFTGADRHRYIGGALRNMGKAKAPPHKTKKPREQIVLTARKNAEASKGKPYDVYSIYKGKELWSNQHFRKLSAAKHEAKIEQDAHNQGYKRTKFK